MADLSLCEEQRRLKSVLMQTSTIGQLDSGAMVIHFDWRDFLEKLSPAAKSHVRRSRANQITFTSITDEHIRGTPVEDQLNRIVKAAERLLATLEKQAKGRNEQMRFRMPKIKYAS